MGNDKGALLELLRVSLGLDIPELAELCDVKNYRRVNLWRADKFPVPEDVWERLSELEKKVFKAEELILKDSKKQEGVYELAFWRTEEGYLENSHFAGLGVPFKTYLLLNAQLFISLRDDGAEIFVKYRG